MSAFGTDLRRDICCAATAQIVNLLAGDHPAGKAQLYGQVLFIVQCAFDEAEKCVSARRLRISDN